MRVNMISQPSSILGISHPLAEAMSFEDWQIQWAKDHESIQMDEDPDHATSKRMVHEIPSAVFECDHCREKGSGIPFALPDPTGEVGPQGSFCSLRCAKAVSEFELGRDDVSTLIDQMAGCIIEPAPPYVQLKAVLKTEGLVREDWTNEMVVDEEDELDVIVITPEVERGTGITKKNKK